MSGHYSVEEIVTMYWIEAEIKIKETPIFEEWVKMVGKHSETVLLKESFTEWIMLKNPVESKFQTKVDWCMPSNLIKDICLFYVDAIVNYVPLLIDLIE